jgi:iduronate 2-sulfatase
LCGLPKPDGLEGLSFVPLLERPERPWKTAAFTVVSHAGNLKGGTGLDPTKLGRTVRTERWRYTEWFDGSVELYDHNTDPHEFANLANVPKHAATRAELNRTLTEGWKAALPN